MQLDGGHFARQQSQAVAEKKLETQVFAMAENFSKQHPLDTSTQTKWFKQFDEQLEQQFSTHNTYVLARKALLKWVRRFNKEHGIQLNEPMIPIVIERDKLTIEYDWFVQGSAVSQTVHQMQEKWLNKHKFSTDDYIQGFLYSTIMYGGLNDTKALQALYEWLLTDRVMYFTQLPDNSLPSNDPTQEIQHPSQQYRAIIPLAVESQKYGCREAEDAPALMRYISYMPDDLSLCFLYALKDKDLTKRKVVHLNTHIDRLCKTFGLVNKKPDQPYLSQLIRYANFHWRQTQGSQIATAMVHILQGRQKTTAITTEKLLQYNQESLQTTTLNEVNSRLFNQLFSHSRILNDQTPTKPNPKSYPEFSRNLIKQLQDALKLSRNQATFTIEGLLAHYPQDNAQRLIGWVLSMLAMSPHLIANRSISHYIGIMGRQWLTLSMDEDISLWEAEDYEEVYQEIIASKVDDGRKIELVKKPDDSEEQQIQLSDEDYAVIAESPTENPVEHTNEAKEASPVKDVQSYTSGRLRAFHEYQIKAFSAPPVSLPWLQTNQVIKANVISPKIYHAMLGLIRQTQLPEEDRQLSECVIILAYRLGLRINELAGIQVADIEGITSLWLRLRPNRYRRLKSYSAKRFLPIQAVLKSDEFNLFVQFLARKKRLNHRYLFSIGNGNQPLPLPFFANLTKLCWDILLEKHDFTFHSFRHTTISQLAVVFNANPTFAPLLTDYTPEQAQPIKDASLGKNQGQSHWFGLASFAGHLNPEVTFEHYVHTAYLVAGLQQHSVRLKMPLLLLQAIGNFDYQKIYHIDKYAYDSQSKTVDLSLLRQFFCTKLCQKQPLFMQNQVEIAQALPSQADIISFDSPPFFLHINFDDVIAFLEELQKLPSESWDKHYASIALRHDIAQHSAGQILQNLQHSATLEKSKLLWEYPKGQAGQKQVRQLLNNAKQLAMTDPEGLRRFIEIFAKKHLLDTSSIRFGHKPSEKAMLKDFVSIGCRLLADENWQLKAKTKAKAKKLLHELGLSEEIMTDTQSSYHGYQVNIVAKAKRQPKNPDDKAQTFYKSFGVLKFCGCLLVGLKNTM